MNDRDALFRYRLDEAEETLADARAMLANGINTRSVINRVRWTDQSLLRLTRILLRLSTFLIVSTLYKVR